MAWGKLAVTLLAGLLVCVLAADAQIIQNPSFDDNPLALDSWIVVNWAGGSGSWFAVSGTVSPLSGFSVPTPQDGAFAALSDQYGPGSHVLYQDITLPQNASALLNLYLFAGNRSGSWVVLPTLNPLGPVNQQVRIDIMDPSAPVFDVGTGVLRNLFITDPSDPLVYGYMALEFDLSDFAGQTIRLRFAEVDNQLWLQMGVDALQLETTPLWRVVPLGRGGYYLDRRNESPQPIVGYQPLCATYEVGAPIIGDFGILDDHSRAVCWSAMIVGLSKVNIAQVPYSWEQVAGFVCRYSREHRSYHFEIDTANLEPGVYDLYVGFHDAYLATGTFPEDTSIQMRVQITEPGE